MQLQIVLIVTQGRFAILLELPQTLLPAQQATIAISQLKICLVSQDTNAQQVSLFKSNAHQDNTNLYHYKLLVTLALLDITVLNLILLLLYYAQKEAIV